MASTLDSMTVRKFDAALGAEVLGIDCADLSDGQFERLRDALHDNIMLAVRDQALTPEEQVAFTRRFGEIQYHINSEYKLPGLPEVLILSTEMRDGKNVGIPDAGSDWHSDHAYVDRPTAYTILQSITLPKHGGDTEWKNMALAYETLSDELKARIEGLIGINTFNRYRNPRSTHLPRHADPERYYAERSPPDAFHPLVRTHPFTGRKALFCSPRFTIGIVGMDDAEAQPLLDQLFAHMDDGALDYHHKWRAGDLVMWDNRSCLHLACGGVEPPDIRHMNRTTVLGEVPV